MDTLTPQAVLTWLLDWTRQYPGWTGLIVFGTALLESLVLVGVLVPGALLMLAAGALIALGSIELWPTLLWAIAGAIAGDGISYWFGYHFRDHLRTMWPFSRFTSLLQRGEQFFARHGGKSVVFGRFFGPVRAVVPTIAGMMGMTPVRFFIINVLSAVVWAPAYILPGVVFGASLQVASHVAGRLVLLVLLVLGVVLLTAWAVRRVFVILQPRVDAMVTRIERWGDAHPGIGGIGTALVDARQPEVRALLLLAALLLVAGVTFFAILLHLTMHSGRPGFDTAIFQLMRSLRTPWADDIMVTITMLADPVVDAAVSSALLLWLLYKRNTSAAIHLLAAVAFGIVLIAALKLTLQVPRPTVISDGISAFSFPSGHTTMSMVIYGFAAVLLARELAPLKRRLVYVLTGSWVILVALSRLYLGAHWVSDVAGGLMLGLAWVALLGIAYRRRPSRALRPAGLIAVVGLTLATVASAHISLDFHAQRQRYALTFPVRALDATQWWQQAWADLPTYRDDLRGSRRQPLNLQWAGTLDELARHLRRHGWHAPTPLTVASSLTWLSPAPTLAHRPLLPQVNGARHEKLVLIHDALIHGAKDAQHQWVVRLWPAAVELTPARTPLWVGSVSRQTLTHSLYFFSYPLTDDDFDSPMQQLTGALAGLSWRMAQRPQLRPPIGVRWNGDVLLLRSPDVSR